LPGLRAQDTMTVTASQPLKMCMPQDIAAAFLVAPATPVDLAKRDPGDNALVGDKDAAKSRTDEDAEAIGALQDRLYAEGKRALLVVLQGTDTSGKDGTVRKVFRDTTPLGVSVTAFKRPSEEELDHDFLWRVHHACPRRGMIGIFNRSHYEDVLVGRVRKLAPSAAIEQRYAQINAFEQMLTENGTTVLKFMLHISKKEQAERLQARIDEREKNWKFNPGDLDDRKLWDEYQKAYGLMLKRCSTAYAPWYVIPADKKWARDAAIAAIVRATLEKMNPQFPKPDWDPRKIIIS
jgi:PPK2 family polyphosphate:nucleotide phosphotransferase